MKSNKWTKYLKILRNEAGFTLEDAAQRMKLSTTYLFDLENGNTDPTKKDVEATIELYTLDEESKRILYDAAAEALDIIPYDVMDFLKNNPDVLQMIIKQMNDKNNQDKIRQ